VWLCSFFYPSANTFVRAAAMPNNDLAFDRQPPYDLFVFNVTLHGHHGRNGL